MKKAIISFLVFLLSTFLNAKNLSEYFDENLMLTFLGGKPFLNVTIKPDDSAWVEVIDIDNIKITKDKIYYTTELNVYGVSEDKAFLLERRYVHSCVDDLSTPYRTTMFDLEGNNPQFVPVGSADVPDEQLIIPLALLCESRLIDALFEIGMNHIDSLKEIEKGPFEFWMAASSYLGLEPELTFTGEIYRRIVEVGPANFDWDRFLVIK